MPIRSKNQIVRGVGYGRADDADPNQSYRSSKSPFMAARFLFSCGYKTGKLVPVRGGWLRGEVADRETGEPRGVRFVRAKKDGGFECCRVIPGAA